MCNNKLIVLGHWCIIYGPYLRDDVLLKIQYNGSVKRNYSD